MAVEGKRGNRRRRAVRALRGGIAAVEVLVVTEIRLYRDGVADCLRRVGGIAATTAATGSSAVLAVRRGSCDVVLLDMAIADATDLVRALLAVRPGLKIVALGVPEDSMAVVASAEAGVCGYVSRDASLEDVGNALKATLRGEAPVPGRVAAGLLQHIAFRARSREPAASGPQLTPREREVLCLLQTGMTNRQIARTLDLQLSTVKNHVHSVLAKSGATARTDVPPVPAPSRIRLDPDPV